MVQHCFNPACHQDFQLLYAGDLYALERGSADTEFFWLCIACASRFDLFVDDSGTISLSDRRAARIAARTPPQGELRLISRCARPAPRLDSRPTAERKYSFVHGAEPHFSGYRASCLSDGWNEAEIPAKSATRTAA
jgi:hypothetical protein